MLDGHLLKLSPATLSSSAWEKRAVSVPDPRQNRLLAALPPADFERLLHDLEPYPLPPGAILHGAGDRDKYVYFLTSGIVSRFYMTESGATSEFAVTGNEGIIGIAAFLGGESTVSEAVVLCAGFAYRIKAECLIREFEKYGALAHLLLRYTQALMSQTGQNAVCNRHHTLEQQLCGWILSCLDRLPSNELKQTQELIAQMLGVRRESITEAAGKLQKAGLIHYTRGRIAALDRQKLEAHACECYRVVKHEYDRLLGPENGSGVAGASSI